MSIKISSDTIGNRSRDLPVCSAVPQPLRHRVPVINLVPSINVCMGSGGAAPLGTRMKLAPSCLVLSTRKGLQVGTVRLPVKRGAGWGWGGFGVGVVVGRAGVGWGGVGWLMWISTASLCTLALSPRQTLTNTPSVPVEAGQPMTCRRHIPLCIGSNPQVLSPVT
jgi:hypothetical protein